MGLGGAEVILHRRAVFEEVGAHVLMTLALPELLPATDVDGLAAIDSGFATVFRYRFATFQTGVSVARVRHERTVRLQYDLWNKRYEVTTEDEGGIRATRVFLTRSEAIAAAVELRRVRVVSTSGLGRGPSGPYSFVTVHAQRNPLEPEGEGGPPGDDTRGAPVPGRDVRWFATLVDFLAGDRAEAEVELHVRTNPFYLVPR